MSQTAAARHPRFRSFRWFDHYKRPPSEYEEITVFYSTWGIPYLADQTTSPIVSPIPFHMNPDYTPIHGFMKEHTAWKHTGWENFRDPHQVYYKTYNEMQWEAERSVNDVLSTARSLGTFNHLDTRYAAFLTRILPPQRYCTWSVVKALFYVGNRVPSSPINACVVFQLADGLREVQRCITWSEEIHASAEQAKHAWLTDSAWQPLREYSERLMALQDWGEILVVSNAILAPLLHALFNVLVANIAISFGDLATAHLLRSLAEDQRRRRDWTNALLAFIQEDTAHGAENRAINQTWVNNWAPLAARATRVLLPLFAEFVDTQALQHELFEDWSKSLENAHLLIATEVLR